MRKFIKLVLLFIFPALLCGLNGCAMLNNEPLTVSEVQAIFDRDKDSLLLLKDYFMNTGYTDLYIYEDCETARANLDKFSINDATAISTFKQLVKNDYELFYKHGNTIVFITWMGIRDISCGIAYSTDGEEISVQYMTESVPLSEDGWFYYVVDYNEWRSRTRDGLREPD